MTREDFLTDAFYKDSELTLRIFNKLLNSDYVLDKEMYGDGTFLGLELEENEQIFKILSKIISDFKKYKTFCLENFVNDSLTTLDLNGLQYIHANHFGKYKEIKFDRNENEFVFVENLERYF